MQHGFYLYAEAHTKINYRDATQLTISQVQNTQTTKIENIRTYITQQQRHKLRGNILNTPPPSNLSYNISQ